MTATATSAFTARVGQIEISTTLAITAEAAQLRAEGADIVDFGAGEPHFETPRHIKDAGIAAIEQNFTRYTSVFGIPELRRAIVERHAADFGSHYSPKETIFSTGGKLALFNAIQCLVEEGDEVILPVPYWVSFKDIVQYAGGKPVYLETSEADDFRITAAAIERVITPRTKAIILNSPSNPSGAVIATADLEQLVRLAKKRNIWLLLDECYVYLRYDGEMVSGGSFAEGKDNVVILGSLSKTYAMTGWRAGYALAPQPLIEAMGKLQSQSTSSTSSIVQKAAVAALTGSQECVATMRADYVKLRNRMLAGVREIPLVTCTEPEGAFYVYPNVSAYIGRAGVPTATELSRRLLHEAHVVTVPGEAFGTTQHIRLSYAAKDAHVTEGIARLKKFFRALA
jgi:aspartate aminotransferase